MLKMLTELRRSATPERKPALIPETEVTMLRTSETFPFLLLNQIRFFLLLFFMISLHIHVHVCKCYEDFVLFVLSDT